MPRRTDGRAISAFAQNPYQGFHDAIGRIVAKISTADVDEHLFAAVQYYWPSLEAARPGILSRL
jgi:hypothetical protein